MGQASMWGEVFGVYRHLQGGLLFFWCLWIGSQKSGGSRMLGQVDNYEWFGLGPKSSRAKY